MTSHDDHEAMRELLALDPREAYPEITVDVSDIGRGASPICILCESGYHDHEWEITHVMKCGCPCHVQRASAKAGA